MLFGLIFWSKHSDYIRLPQPSSTIGVVTLDLAVAMWAGFVGTFVKMPFDVAKSRIQNQPMAPPGGSLKYTSTLQCCASIFRYEGFLSLYKGLTPTLWRMVLGQGVAYASFEFALARLRSVQRIG